MRPILVVVSTPSRVDQMGVFLPRVLTVKLGKSFLSKKKIFYISLRAISQNDRGVGEDKREIVLILIVALICLMLCRFVIR